jgi:molybdenum cofactor cytidylyltransferase
MLVPNGESLMAGIGLVLLAAGGSSRMGSPKQLLPYNGQPLVRHAARIALSSRCSPVIIVVGSAASQVRGALAELPIEIIENQRWTEGMGTSIIAGVTAARERGLAGVILALADQPLVTSAVYDRLIDAQAESGQPVVASEYAETAGVPALFMASFFDHLLALKPTEGCKGLILAHPADALRIPCPEAETDIDTREDYAAI